MSDGSMGVTDAYAYDAWGNGLPHFGTAQQPYQYVGELGYYAHYQDPAFGLLQLGARYYHPGIGRFISRDPIKDGTNWYAYVDNQPTGAVDPLGLDGIGFGGGFALTPFQPYPIDIGPTCRWFSCRDDQGCLHSGLICSICAGVSTPGRSLIVGAVGTNCKDLSGLTGLGAEAGAGSGPLTIGGGVGLRWGWPPWTQTVYVWAPGQQVNWPPAVWGNLCYSWIVWQP